MSDKEKTPEEIEGGEPEVNGIDPPPLPPYPPGPGVVITNKNIYGLLWQINKKLDELLKEKKID